jgi:hypothetical protein
MPDTLSDDQRYSISDAMMQQYLAGEPGVNKCFDCCLVPGCDECGPCAAHDEPTEAAAAMAWVDAHRHLY